MNRKNLTLNGLTIPHTIYIIVSVLMVVVGIYLTNHFYQAHFPTGLGGGDSLCRGDGFWGCDKATLSSLGHIFYVPTSFFGIIIGAIGIFGAIFPSEGMERTNKLLIILNAIGCLGLLAFSIIGLKGLCQFCTAYYLLSFAAAYLFFKHSELPPKPDFKILGVYAALVILPGIYMNNHFKTQTKRQTSLSSQYVEQYQNLQDMGEPTYLSPYRIHSATEAWEGAPIRVAVFSDFQCPFCKRVSEQMPELVRGFEDKINIAYYFYPLDNACNPDMKGSMHQFACKAAYLAACDQEKFPEVHDAIFERQDQLSYENLDKWAKEFELENCFENAQLQDVVTQTLNAGDQYNLKSTPTMIINGKKIEGSIPTVYLRAIFQSILDKKAEQ